MCWGSAEGRAERGQANGTGRAESGWTRPHRCAPDTLQSRAAAQDTWLCALHSRGDAEPGRHHPGCVDRPSRASRVLHVCHKGKWRLAVGCPQHVQHSDAYMAGTARGGVGMLADVHVGVRQRMQSAAAVCQRMHRACLHGDCIHASSQQTHFCMRWAFRVRHSVL